MPANRIVRCRFLQVLKKHRVTSVSIVRMSYNDLGLSERVINFTLNYYPGIRNKF